MTRRTARWRLAADRGFSVQNTARARRHRPFVTESWTVSPEQGAWRRAGAARRSEEGLDEQPRVPKVPVVLDHPVEVAAGRVAGCALEADDLPGLDRTPDTDPAGERVALHVGVPRLQVGGVDDEHDPGRLGAVGVVPAEVAGPAWSGGRDRGAAALRRDDVDAVVEVRAALAGPIAGIRAAAELTGDHALHRPLERAVELRRDVAELDLLLDELVDLRGERPLRLLPGGDRLREVLLVLDQLRHRFALGREHPLRLFFERLEPRLGRLELDQLRVELLLLPQRLRPEGLGLGPRRDDGRVDRGERSLSVDDLLGEHLVVLGEVIDVADLGDHVGERAARQE